LAVYITKQAKVKLVINNGEDEPWAHAIESVVLEANKDYAFELNIDALHSYVGFDINNENVFERLNFKGLEATDGL